MKKQQLRLINILKTDSLLKKNIEELKFGCIWKHFKHNNYFRYVWEWKNDVWVEMWNDTTIPTIMWDWMINPIWQANYQHLLRYLRHKWIDADIDTYLDLNLKSKGVTVWTLMSFEIGNLLDQEETTLEMLCDYLET